MIATKINKTESSVWFIGIINKFQGIGISLRTDEPIAYKQVLFSFEVLFFWFKYYYVRYEKK